MKHPSRLIGAGALAAAAALIPAAALGADPTAAPTPVPTTTATPAPTTTAAPAPTPTAGPAIPTPPITAAITPAPATASAAACTTPGLVVWLDTQGNGTAGSIYYTLEFTNLSARTCTLKGYPGVSAVNLRGRGLGSAASRDHATTPHLITLAPGATATAVLRIVEAGNFPTATCHPVTAAGLRVYPPNMTTSKVVPFPFSACSSAGPAYLTVRAVRHA
jgi:hypothetical protein